MGSRRSRGEWYACENGHPVAHGSTICVRCGTQVTSKRVPDPRSDSSPDSSTAPHPSPEASARARTLLLAAVAGSIVLALVGGLMVFMVAERSTVSGSWETPPVPAPVESCDNHPEVVIGAEYPNSPAITCFTVDEDSSVVTIAAESADGQALTLEIERTDGVFWGATTLGIEGAPPVLTLLFLPGSYVVTVVGEDGSAPGPFTLLTLEDTADALVDVSDPNLPSLDACGTPEVPWLDPLSGTAELALDGATPHACLRVEEAAFVKVGAESGTDNAANLLLAVHSFGRSGRPVFLRSIDDTFGTDPEMSLDLGSGTFLVEVVGLNAAPIGPYVLYASVDPEFFRVGEVSPGREGVRLADCDSGVIPELRIGRSLVFTDNDPVVCLRVVETQRLVLRAVSFAEQDLVLEVIGFGIGGSPYRFSWVDDDLWASDFNILEPRLDVVLPAGVYVLIATEYNGQATNNLMIAVDASAD